mmetsp:Transcript_81550/g.95069  ORF Transcript_81550/g.95069 Transcript_81550/m.95069 type:complete len:494 (-) Transcript_81550:187-1668(-)
MSFLRRANHSNPMAAIEARQRQEEHVRDYSRVQATNDRQRMIADWEIKTTKVVQSRELYRHMDSVQAQHDDVLVERRQRLAELLLREKEQHEAMLANLNETDEQRRERLTQQARELRTQRETLRQDEANRQKERLFRETSDTLRQTESRVRTLQVADARREQLDEMRRRKEEEADMNRFYEQQKAEQDRQQRERARRDLEAIHEGAEQMKRDLGRQVSANQRRLEEEKQRQAAEDAEFFALLKEEQTRNAEKDAARKQRQQDLAVEIKTRNEELRQIKQLEYDRLRQEDKDTLDALLKGIAEDEQRELERKKAQREAAVAHMRVVEQQMNEQAANESVLDKLWQDENDKEWEKREKKWLAEQSTRERLLKNVLEGRRNQVRDIRSRDEEHRNQKKRDHEHLITTMQNAAHAETKLREERRSAAYQNRDFLHTQMTAKKEATMRDVDAKFLDASGAQAAEQAYREKLEAELQRLEAAKPEAYRHVGILPTSGRR